MVAWPHQQRHLARLTLVGNYDKVAKIAAAVAFHRHPRAVAQSREVEPVVRILVRGLVPLDLQVPILVRACGKNRPAVGVEPSRTRPVAVLPGHKRRIVYEVVEPVSVPIVLVYPPIYPDVVVAADNERAGVLERYLCIHGNVRVAAREEPLPRDRPRSVLRPHPHPAFALHGERVADSRRNRAGGRSQPVLKPPVHEPPERRISGIVSSVRERPPRIDAIDRSKVNRADTEVRPSAVQMQIADMKCVRRHGKRIAWLVRLRDKPVPLLDLLHRHGSTRPWHNPARKQPRSSQFQRAVDPPHLARKRPRSRPPVPVPRTSLLRLDGRNDRHHPQHGLYEPWQGAELPKRCGNRPTHPPDTHPAVERERNGKSNRIPVYFHP